MIAWTRGKIVDIAFLCVWAALVIATYSYRDAIDNAGRRTPVPPLSTADSIKLDSMVRKAQAYEDTLFVACTRLAKGRGWEFVQTCQAELRQ